MTDDTKLMAEASNATADTLAPIVGGGELLSMSISMLLVVAVILVLGWIYSRTRLSGTGASDVIGIVASRALGPKERLLIVEVADQQLLIGMTSSAVQTLHIFDTPIDVSEPKASVDSFAARLRAALPDRKR